MTGNGKRRPEVRIDGVKPYSKNTLIAFVDFTIVDVGLRIKGATVHEKEGKRWVSMPAREYTTTEGRSWSPVIEFDTKEARYAVNDAVVEAFDAFRAKDGNTPATAGGEDTPW